MLKIALIELYGHYEVLFAFAETLFPHTELSLFTKKAGWAFAPVSIKETGVVTEVLMEESEPVPAFLLKHKLNLEACDWVIFTTILGDFKFHAKFTLATRTMLVIHNGNYWLSFTNNIKIRTVLDFLRLVKYSLLRQYKFRKVILENIDLITFPNDEIAENFKNIRPDLFDKFFPPLPFFVPIEVTEKEGPSNEVTIVIPGRIANDSRDYGMVMNAFQKYENNQVEGKKINLVLLGKPVRNYGQKKWKALKTLDRHQFSVIGFLDDVSQVEYDNWLMNADFLILPLSQDMSYGICVEKGGVTKISGTINDALRFQKPALVYSGYKLEKFIEAQMTAFQNADDLCQKITEWVIDAPLCLNYIAVKKEWESRSQRFVEKLKLLADRASTD
jgi:hypothetical protein